MGFSNLSIRHRITSLAMTVMLGAMLLCSSLQAQEKPQPGGAGAVLGADNEPVMVVTVASMNKLMQDVNYLTSLVGQPQLGGVFQMFAGMYSQGIDTTQPMGVLVPMVNGIPEPIFTVPTANVKGLLKQLEAQTGPVDELGDGTLVIAVGANVVYIRQAGNWGIAARSREVLAMAPADPTTLFTGMGNNYDLAVRVKMQKIPAESRDMFKSQLRQGFEKAMAQQDSDSADASREATEKTLEQLEMVIDQSDTIDFGLNVDQTAKQLVLDFSYTTLPGSELASLYGNLKPIESAFASVIRDDAAGYFHTATSISPERVDMLRSSFEGSMTAARNWIENNDRLSADQKVKSNELLTRLVDLYLDSAAEGKIDTGSMLLANEDDFRFVLGGFVSDGNELAQIVKEFAAEIEKETQGQPNAPRFKFDVGQYNEITLHVVEADVPEKEEEVRRVFGEQLQVHIGTGAKSFYIAVGTESLNTLKNLIDAADNDGGAANRPVGQARVKLLPILQFAQSVKDDESIAAMITALTSAADPGLITVISDAIPNGTKSRITIGEGVLQSMGAVQAQKAGAGNF